MLTVAIYATVGSHQAVYEDAAWLTRTMRGPLDYLNLSLWSVLAQGDQVRALHWGNVLLHLVNGLLVYALGRRLGSPLIGMLAAMIFWWSPIQREAVNYISGRPDLISTLLVLLTVHSLLMLQLRWMAPTILLGLLAVLAKPSAILVFILAGMTLLIYRPRYEPILRALMWVGIVGIALVMTIATPIVYEAFLRPPLIDLVEYAGRQAVACLRLFSLVLIPVGFSIDHDFAWVTLTTGLLALAGLGWVARWCWGRRVTSPLIAWAGLWLLIALLPRFLTLGAYPVGQEINEHQYYLAMPGVSIGLASLVKGWL